MNDRRAVRTSFACIIICYTLWGLQPLYWHLDDTFDSMFIMASRSVSASLFCLLLLALQGKLGQLRAVFADKKLLAREIPAAALLFGDWFVFIWAVQHSQVLECSVGYYIQPLVVFAFADLSRKMPTLSLHRPGADGRGHRGLRSGPRGPALGDGVAGGDVRRLRRHQKEPAD